MCEHNAEMCIQCGVYHHPPCAFRPPPLLLLLLRCLQVRSLLVMSKIIHLLLAMLAPQVCIEYCPCSGGKKAFKIGRQWVKGICL
jgi:hypothetical protein